MGTFIGETRQAVRTLIRDPGLTAAAVFVLAMAVGGNAAMFGIVDALLLEPLPRGSATGVLVGVYSRDGSRPDAFRSFSYPNYTDLRTRRQLFSELVAQRFAQVTLTEGNATRRTAAAIVSSNFFSALGAPVILGRGFSAAEERPRAAAAVAVVSHAYLRRRGLEPREAIGDAILIDGKPFTVVGVAPRGFTGTTAVMSPEVWLPVGVYHDLASSGGNQRADPADRAAHLFVLAGVLAPGLTIPAAQEPLGAVARQMEEAYPAANADQTLLAAPLPRLSVSPRPRNDAQLAIVGVLLLGMSGLALVVACLNLANLLLARGISRAPEIAVRLALGATRPRIVRRLLIEGFILSLAGGAVGLVLALGGTVLMVSSILPYVPVGIEFDPRPDSRAMAFTLVICTVSTLAFGLGPAWKLSRPDLVTALKARRGDSGTRAGRRWLPAATQMLMIGQLAISLALLTTGALFARAAAYAGASDPGFSPERRVLATVDAGASGYDDARGRALYRTLLDRIRALPGVEAATLASIVPFGDITEDRYVERRDADGRDGRGEPTRAVYTVIGAEYFRGLGLSVSGREFSPGEEASSAGLPVAIVNEPLARRLFPGEAATSRTLCLRTGQEGTCDVVHVVGIVPGLRHDLLRDEPGPHVYVPFGQRYRGNMTLQVTTAASSLRAEAAMVQRLRRVVEEVNGGLSILSVETMREHLSGNIGLWLTRTAAVLSASFGILTLLLAAVGTYGLRSNLIARQTREIGIRLALGATPGRIERRYVFEGLKLTGAGVAGGLALGAAAGTLSSSLLYRVSPFDPVAFGAAVAVLVLTSTVASYLPARRAAHMPPSQTLRTD